MVFSLLILRYQCNRSLRKTWDSETCYRQGRINISVAIFQHGLKMLMLKEVIILHICCKLLPRPLSELCASVHVGIHTKEPIILSFLCWNKVSCFP